MPNQPSASLLVDEFVISYLCKIDSKCSVVSGSLSDSILLVLVVFFAQKSDFEQLLLLGQQHFAALFWYLFLNMILSNLHPKNVCYRPIRLSQCLPCEKLLFACLLNPIKSRLLRDLGTKRLGCERFSIFGLVWMTLMGSNAKPEIIDAMIVDKNFIFWNSKMISKNRLLRNVTENKNHIRIKKRITENRLGYLSLYFGSLKTHRTINLRIKPLRHSSLTPW